MELLESNLILCEFCKRMKQKNRLWQKGWDHVNIEQDPTTHNFCSRSCKRKWNEEEYLKNKKNSKK